MPASSHRIGPPQLKVDRRIHGRLSAEVLWAALVRRAQHLAAVHGSGDSFPELDTSPAFELASAESRVVDVRRHSARQGTGMT